jgi:DNA-directed RNA polymerase specialized sigma24 family protein
MYTNSQMIAVIDEHVHSSWQRQALKLRFCDGLTHEQIAEKMGYSTQYIKEIVKRHKPTLFANL